MNKFDCEMYGHFAYDDILSYDALLERESWMIGQIQMLLEENEAEHIDFTPQGDALMVQCAFGAYDPESFFPICKQLCHVFPPQMEGRLLFINKHLGSLRIFHFTHKDWKESIIEINTASEILFPKT